MTQPSPPAASRTPSSGGPRPPEGRVGTIVLARHGEPALSRKIKLDARAYDRWWAAYEAGGILPGQIAPEGLLQSARDADLILSSSRRRAVETAEIIAAGKPFERDDIFVEAPLPAPATPAFVRFDPKVWGVVTRFLWWFFGHSRGQESRSDAQTRARAAVSRLVAEAEAGRDVLVIAHGFFNSMMGLELTRQGWLCTRDRGFKYWSTRRFERGEPRRARRG